MLIFLNSQFWVSDVYYKYVQTKIIMNTINMMQLYRLIYYS